MALVRMLKQEPTSRGVGILGLQAGEEVNDTPRAGSMRDASAVLRRRGDAGRKKLRGAS